MYEPLHLSTARRQVFLHALLLWCSRKRGCCEEARHALPYSSASRACWLNARTEGDNRVAQVYKVHIEDIFFYAPCSRLSSLNIVAPVVALSLNRERGVWPGSCDSRTCRSSLLCVSQVHEGPAVGISSRRARCSNRRGTCHAFVSF